MGGLKMDNPPHNKNINYEHTIYNVTISYPHISSYTNLKPLEHLSKSSESHI